MPSIEPVGLERRENMKIRNIKRLQRIITGTLAAVMLTGTMIVDTHAAELKPDTKFESYEYNDLDEFIEANNESDELNTMVLTVVSDKELSDTYGAVKSIDNNGIYVLTYSNVRKAKTAKKKFEKQGLTVNYEQTDKEIILEETDTGETVSELTKLSENTERTYGKTEEGSAASVDGIKTITKNRVVIAVIDNQIDYSDKNLKDRLVKSTVVTNADGTKQKQFIIIPENSIEGEFTKNTHATLIAKTIISQTDNNVFVAPVNVSDKDGNIKLSSVISAIYDAIDMGVDIINISLNTKGTSNLLEKAIKDATDKGIQVVVSAGNNQADVSEYIPANIEDAIVVNAVKDNEISKDSNTGKTIDYSADGIITYNTGDKNKNNEDIIKQTEGTSIASAKVSAYIALILSAYSDGYINPVLNKAAVDLGDTGFDTLYGNGYLTRENILQTLSDKEFLKAVEDSLVKKDLTDIKKDNTEVTLPNSPENDFLLEQSVNEHWAGPYIEGHSGTVNGEYITGWSTPSFRYGAYVDRTGGDYNYNEWIEGNARGAYVKDRTGSMHTICNGAEFLDDKSVNFDNFWAGNIFHACQVGITYWMGVGAPSKYGYNFTGWTGGNNLRLEDNGLWWTEVGAYAPDQHLYMNWECNHEGATKEKYNSGSNPDNCGYYHCTRCDATWGTWSHSWESSWSYNNDTHWHYCSWNHNHWKDNAVHTCQYWYSDNEHNYYKCTTCDYSYSETRYYTVNYYIRNENADGTWGGYWYWTSANYTYGQYYHADGYGNDNDGPDNAEYQNFCVTGGPVTEDKNIYIDAYKRWYHLDLNAYYNGIDYGGLKCGDIDLGTCDLYVNGTKIVGDISDVYDTFRYGSTYEFKNIKMKPGLAFTDLGNLTGTITGDTEAKPYIYDTYALAYYDGNGANEGNDYYESYSLRNNDTPKLNSNIFSKYNCSFKGYDSGLSVGDTIGFSDNYSGKAAIRSGYNNSLVMNIAASDNINGTNILLWWDDESNICNYWNFIPTGDGYFYIISSAYGKALDLENYNATDGGNIQLSQFGVGNTAQQWKLIPAGNGYYYIASRVNENYRMDAWGGASASAPLQNIAVYHAVDYAGQMFKIDFLNRQDHFIAQWEEATRLTEYHYAYKFAKDSYFKSFGSFSNGLIDSNKFTKIGYNLKSYQNINHKGTTGHSAEYLEGETIPTDDCNGITLLRNGSNVNYAIKNISLDGTIKAYTADYTKNQWWSFVKSQDNTYYIVNQATGYALYNNNGTVLTKKLDKNNNEFKWNINLVGINEYTISALTGDKTFLTMNNDYSISLQETAKDSYSVWNIDGISSALYVNWKPNTYYVRFNKNRPSNPISIASVIGSMSNQFFTYDEAKNLQSNENGYKLNGYEFKGWSLKPGIQRIDFTDKQSVKNLTTVNGGIVDVYAQWEDLPPKAEDLEIEVANPDVISTTKTVIISAVDEGSGIKEWYFGQKNNPSPNEYTVITPVESFTKTLENSVNKEGEWYLSVKDANGNTTTISKTFYRTTFNPNKDYIWGRYDTYSSIPSLNSETSEGFSINPSGAVITPSTDSAIRSGNTLTGWDTSNSSQRTSSDISVTGNNTCYAIWKDSINPLVVITGVSNNDANSQIITFNLYDLDKNYTSGDFEGKDLEYIKEHGEKTGSDIAAYWFGKNPIYNGDGNSRTATEIVKDEGYSVNLERTVGEAITYYIFAEDKAGNISKVIIAVDGNGKVTPNRNLAFCRLILNANDGSIQENGQSTIQKLIRKGDTYNLTNVHAKRTGYHDTESGADTSIHWSHSKTLGSNIIDEDSQIVTGTNNDDNSESLTEWTAEGNDTLYAKWTPNAYILKVYLNKPVKATEGINTHNTVSSDTNKWVYDTYTGYYKTVLVYDKAWSIPESTAFAGLTGWTTTGFKNVGKTEKSDTAYLNSLNRSYDEADNVSKVSDVGTNLTSVKDDTVAYTMLWKENSYTVNFRANGGTAVKRITLLEKKIDGSVKERTVDTTASADKKATDKTYDTSIIIGYESILKLQNSPVRPGFVFTFFTKDKDYAKTAHMKDDKPDFSKSALCTGELSEEAAKKYREEYKIAGSLDGNEEVDLYSSWSKRKPVTLQSFISANSIRTDVNALTKIALGTYITRDNAKDINSAWFNKNYKTNDKGEYIMNDTVEVLQEWNVTKTEIKQTYSKKIMADNN